MEIRTIIIIIAILTLIVIVAAIVLYLNSRKPSGKTGSTGATGATGAITCTNSCLIKPLGCTGIGSMAITFVGATGTNCPSSCVGTIQTTTLNGCLPPMCNSPFCTPQQTQYRTVNANNSQYNICNSGGVNNGFITSPCPNLINGSFLAGLNITTSDVAANRIFPVFITTIAGSIYDTTTPTPPPGIDPTTIQPNTTDPSVTNDPYLLYKNFGVLGQTLSFQRLSTIKNSLDITNATWILDHPSTGNGTLFLLKELGTGASLNVLVINNINYQGDYYGLAAPCGFVATMNLNQGGAFNTYYDPNSGKILAAQLSTPQTGPQLSTQTSLTVSPNPDTSLTPSGGFLVTGVQIPGINYHGTCNYVDNTRWYSVSATSNFLAP